MKLLFLQGRFELVFMAPDVSLRHAGLIHFGRGVTLEKGVIIDGLSTEGVEIGDNSTIGPYSIIRASLLSRLGKGLHMGSQSSLDAYSFVGAGGGVWVGDRVIMGQHISFHSENHNFQSTEDAIRNQGVTALGIVIEDNCWVGSNVTFLDGVHVGTGCIIAAGAVVTKNIAPYSIAAGIPARIIKTRRASEGQSRSEADSGHMQKSYTD